MEPRDVFSLEQILICCEKIAEAKEEWGGSIEDLDSEWKLQDIFAFRIIQIGEYVNRLSVSFVTSHPEIDWRKVVGMRNILTHNYGKVSSQVLWETIKNNIPELRKFCESQLSHNTKQYEK